MKAKQTAFFCKECGYESAKWMGQCPGCRQWNTFVEEPTAGSFATTKSGGAKKQGLEASKPQMRKTEAVQGFMSWIVFWAVVLLQVL